MKLPKQAKLVFKGKIFDVYQWEQNMFDGTKETFEMLKRPDTIQILPIQGDKILIAEEEQPMKGKFLTLLGGRREENEDPLGAAKRELLEESGYAADDWELINTYEPYTKMDWTVYFYVARDCKKTQEQTLDAGERITVKQVNFDTFLEMIANDQFRARDFTLDLLKMRFLEPKRLEEFKKKLFG